MSRIESPPKKATLSHHIDLDSLDFGWCKELPDVEKELAKSPLQRQIEGIVGRHLVASGNFAPDYREFFLNNQHVIQTLLDAHAYLSRLVPWLAGDDRVPSLRITEKSGPHKGRTIYCNATTFLAQGGVAWVAEWLKAQQRTGRPPETPMASCAEELAELFRRELGRPNWQLVGDILSIAFGEAHSDQRLWAFNMVKRKNQRRSRKRQPRRPA